MIFRNKDAVSTSPSRTGARAKKLNGVRTELPQGVVFFFFFLSPRAARSWPCRRVILSSRNGRERITFYLSRLSVEIFARACSPSTTTPPLPSTHRATERKMRVRAFISRPEGRCGRRRCAFVGVEVARAGGVREDGLSVERVGERHENYGDEG